MFAPHLVHFLQTEINFSCPRAPLEFMINKLLVPPKIYFCPPPVTQSWRRACYALSPDRLPVVRVVFFYLKTNSLRASIFRTNCRSQDSFVSYIDIY